MKNYFGLIKSRMVKRIALLLIFAIYFRNIRYCNEFSILQLSLYYLKLHKKTTLIIRVNGPFTFLESFKKTIIEINK